MPLAVTIDAGGAPLLDRVATNTIYDQNMRQVGCLAYTATLYSPTTPTPSPAPPADTHSGLSRGALAVAVVLPIVCVVLLVGLVMWWMRRAGGGLSCCGQILRKDTLDSSGLGQQWRRHAEMDERDVSYQS